MARPRARTTSGVSSTLATPRTPSVPNLALATRLPLGVLGSLAGLLQAVLLRFLLAGVPGQETRLLQRAAQLGIELAQGPGDAEAERSCLTRHPAPVDGDIDVPGLRLLSEPQGLGHDHPVCR